MATLGVIGGSGVYDISDFEELEVVDIDTAYGRPSAPIRAGRIDQTEILFLPRHGQGHVYSPTDLPYRANVLALKLLGATHVLSLSAVGSLREDLPPRSLHLPNQIIDRTLRGGRSFFEDGVVVHVGLADPYCASFQDAVARAAADVKRAVSRGGTYVCIEGPQFSTRAESQLYRSWGATVIGMTAMPEARLAREAELCYATLAMVTDYDVWHDTEADVSVDIVASHMRANGEAAAAILRQLAANELPDRTCGCASALDFAVMTAPSAIGTVARARVGSLLGARLGDDGESNA